MQRKMVFQAWNDSGVSLQADGQALDIADLGDESLDRPSQEANDAVLTCCCVNQTPQD